VCSIDFGQLNPLNVDHRHTCYPLPFSTMVLCIPVEIWLLIASFVRREDYDKLINVNTVFFNIIMDNRYQEVYIGYIDNDYMRKKLVRLW
jgi:hypothetical protein